MGAPGDRSRRVLLLGGAGLALTLLALGTAAWALVRAEGERGRRRAADRAASHARELLVRLARSAASDHDGPWVVLDERGELLAPEPPVPFDPLPPVTDDEAAFMIARVPAAGDMDDAALRLALRSGDPVARLRAAATAMRRGGDTASLYVAARVPESLVGTQEGVFTGLMAGDAAALHRALQRVGGPGDAVAAALLVGTAGDGRNALALLRGRRNELARAHDLLTLFRSAPPIDPEMPDRVLIDVHGGAFVALPRGPAAAASGDGDGSEGAWWLTRLSPGALQRVAARTPGDDVRVVAAGENTVGESHALPGGGGWRVVTGEEAGAPGGLLVAGFAVAAFAAIAAFAAFARGVLRETRLTRLRSEFVATVGHELRTPVAVIRSAAEALLMGRAKGDDDRARLVRGIVRESERLSGLLGNVLDFARMEAGRRRFSFAPHAAAEIVCDAASASAGALERARTALELDVAAGLPPLCCDRDALRAALVNLLDNAAKFGRCEPIVVRAARRGDDVVIEVIDRGPGVPLAERTRVFERFFRGAGETVRETRGTGIGLALVRHAAEAHGGRAEVTETPGGGATFRIVLPVRGAEED